MRIRILVGLCALSLIACKEEAPSAPAAETAPAPAEKATPAADKADPPADIHAGLDKYEIDQVAALIDDRKVVPVDANSDETREKLGTLPGALLLSNSKKFDLSELPDDTTQDLVFYCGSEKCRSAPKAARRARDAGYKNVHVMPAGIRGWVKAGKPVDKQS